MRASLKSKRDLESVHGIEFFFFRCASVHSPLVLSPEMQKEGVSRTGRWKREVVDAARWHRSFLSSKWFYHLSSREGFLASSLNPTILTISIHYTYCAVAQFVVWTGSYKIRSKILLGNKIHFEPIWTLNVDKNVLSYTEEGLKESRNVCKYR